jgi:hypothetical protein
MNCRVFVWWPHRRIFLDRRRSSEAREIWFRILPPALHDASIFLDRLVIAGVILMPIRPSFCRVHFHAVIFCEGFYLRGSQLNSGFMDHSKLVKPPRLWCHCMRCGMHVLLHKLMWPPRGTDVLQIMPSERSLIICKRILSLYIYYKS